MSDPLMAEFARYRTFHGLPRLPEPDESSPAILSVAGNVARHLTPTAVYLIAKEVFRRAAERLEPADPAGAATLRRASTHWLRHSAASHQADAGTDIRFIQRNLRHASIETTGGDCISKQASRAATHRPRDGHSLCGSIATLAR